MRVIWAALAAVAMSLPAGLAAAADAPGRLSVTGEGKVAVAPDMAIVTLGAVAEHAEAAEAMAQMSARMSAVLARLEAAGIAPRDIQTSGLSLDPRWAEKHNPRSMGGEGGIVGFVASSTATLRVRDLDALGGLLDAVVRDGANDFRGLRFGLQAPEPVRDAARQAAVAEAIRKAELYAAAAGVTLGPILSIDEHGGAQPRMMRAEMASFAADAGMPVAAGELEIAASVSITWALAPQD